MPSERKAPAAAQRLAARVRLKVRDAARSGRSRVTRVSHHSTNQNIFHCCVHKTGSQWIRHLLADPLVYQHSGLRTYHYQPSLPPGVKALPIDARSFPGPIPDRTIVTPLYINYSSYLAMEKRHSSTNFFVMRDPRDIVVSWYFSSRYSHRLMGDLPEIRQRLESLPQRDGFSFAIRYLAEFGLFTAMRSWADAARDGRDVLVIKFEDLVGPNQEATFATLFSHCDIAIPPAQLHRLCEEYSFRRRSGRHAGEEDPRSQYRKGVPGDWRRHFDDRLLSEFADTTRDLVAELGYESPL
jgi:hypothetical protein